MSAVPRLAPALALGLLALLLESVFLVVRRLHPLDENVVWVIAAALAASVLYLVAAYLVLASSGSRSAVLAVVLLAALAFRATLFSLPPTLSEDLHRYQWDGRIQLAGHNPYLVAPADPGLEQHLPEEPTRLAGPNHRSLYPPLTELSFRLAAWLDGVAAFKLLSLAFDLGTLLLLVRLLRIRGQPPERALLYAWCPLVVVEFAGSGHNDSLALFALLLATSLIIRQRATVSIVALAAAAMSKWFAVVLAPVFLRRSGWRGLPLFLGTAAALFLPYRDAGWGLFSGLLSYAEKWRNNSSLYDLVSAATGQETIAAGVALGVVAGLSLHCAWTRADPLRAAHLLIAATLFLSPNVFPWYVTWLVPFLCFFPNPGLLLFTATIFLSYHVLIGYTARGVWHYEPWLVWLEYLPVYALLLIPFLLSPVAPATGEVRSPRQVPGGSVW